MTCRLCAKFDVCTRLSYGASDYKALAKNKPRCFEACPDFREAVCYLGGVARNRPTAELIRPWMSSLSMMSGIPSARMSRRGKGHLTSLRLNHYYWITEATDPTYLSDISSYGATTN